MLRGLRSNPAWFQCIWPRVLFFFFFFLSAWWGQGQLIGQGAKTYALPKYFQQNTTAIQKMIQILKSWCSYVKAVFRIIPLAFYCSNLWGKKHVYPESSLRPWFTLTKIRESGVLLGLVAGLRIKPPKLCQLHYLPGPEYYPPLPGQSRPSHPYSIEAKSSESAESKAHKNQKRNILAVQINHFLLLCK